MCMHMYLRSAYVCSYVIVLRVFIVVHINVYYRYRYRLRVYVYATHSHTHQWHGSRALSSVADVAAIAERSE